MCPPTSQPATLRARRAPQSVRGAAASLRWRARTLNLSLVSRLAAGRSQTLNKATICLEAACAGPGRGRLPFRGLSSTKVADLLLVACYPGLCHVWAAGTHESPSPQHRPIAARRTSDLGFTITPRGRSLVPCPLHFANVPAFHCLAVTANKVVMRSKPCRQPPAFLRPFPGSADWRPRVLVRAEAQPEAMFYLPPTAPERAAHCR